MYSIAPPSGRVPLAAAAALLALSPLAHAGTPPPAHSPEPESLVVRVDGAFHWGDAGIGAAAGFGAGLVLAGSLALAGRSDRAVVHHSQNKEDPR